MSGALGLLDFPQETAQAVCGVLWNGIVVGVMKPTTTERRARAIGSKFCGGNDEKSNVVSFVIGPNIWNIFKILSLIYNKNRIIF